MADYILGGILALAVAFVLYKRIRAWRNGRYCGCSDGKCSGCRNQSHMKR